MNLSGLVVVRLTLVVSGSPSGVSGPGMPGCWEADRYNTWENEAWDGRLGLAENRLMATTNSIYTQIPSLRL